MDKISHNGIINKINGIPVVHQEKIVHILIRIFEYMFSYFLLFVFSGKFQFQFVIRRRDGKDITSVFQFPEIFDFEGFVACGRKQNVRFLYYGVPVRNPVKLIECRYSFQWIGIVNCGFYSSLQEMGGDRPTDFSIT